MALTARRPAAGTACALGGLPLTWSDNGNLLADGTSTYQWDHANRLIGVAQGADSYVFSYNALGDRLRQTVNGVPTSYTLDLESGLTQVLSDGTNAYLYGSGRLAEEEPGGWAYHLPDALGSVRQLADASGGVTLSHAFEPYGESLASSGAGDSAYGYTGEWTDGTGLVHLRARYYAPYLKQWTQPDPIVPDPRMPADRNRYAYVRNNPVNYTDPSGQCIDTDLDGRCDWWPLATQSLPPPSVAGPAISPLSVFDLVDAFTDCGPRPSAYEHVVATEIRRIEQRYGVHLGVHAANGKKGEWRLGALGTVENALATVDTRLRQAIDMAAWRDTETGRRLPLPPAGETFRRIFSPLELLRGPIDMKFYPGRRWFGKAEQGRTIYLYGLAVHWENGTMTQIILHEIGHVLDQRDASRYSGAMNSAASLSDVIARIRDYEYYPISEKDPKDKKTLGQASGLGINQRSDKTIDEIWADLFASWASGRFGDPRYASPWRDFIRSLMSDIATGNAIEG